MTANGWFQIGLYLLILLAVTKPLGAYMARVFSGERTFLDPIARPVERLLYRVTGVDEKSEMRWTEYALAHAALQRGLDGRCSISSSVCSIGCRGILKSWQESRLISPSTRLHRSPQIPTGRHIPARRR